MAGENKLVAHVAKPGEQTKDAIEQIRFSEWYIEGQFLILKIDKGQVGYNRLQELVVIPAHAIERVVIK